MKTLSVENSLIKARSLSKKGNVSEGINILQSILKNFPNNMRVQKALQNLTSSHVNFTDEAIPDLELKNLFKLFKSIETEKFLFEAEKILRLYPNSFMVWNLVGIVKAKNGNFLEATNCFKKVVELNPIFPDGFNNLGNVLGQQGRFDEALTSFRNALSIKPLMADVYNNIGNIFQKKCEFENAIINYKKAISINHNYIDAINNLGNTFYRLGKSNEAIVALKKAILLDPYNSIYWNNIAYPLRSIKINKPALEKILFDLDNEKNLENHKVNKNILKYKIFRSEIISDEFFNLLNESLAKSKNNKIINSASPIKKEKKEIDLSQDIISLVHFGRSGTGLLHSLIDNHPEISTLPSIYFSEFFDKSTWRKITKNGWANIVDNFMNLYDVLFNARSTTPIQSIEEKMIFNIGVKEGMTNLGNNRDEVLRVDKNEFRKQLKSLLNHYEEINQLTFFKLIHIAYEKTLKNSKNKNKIFYHIHNPDVYAQFNLVQYDKNTNWIIMVREPIQSCESWIRNAFNNKDYIECTFKITKMLIELDNVVYNKSRSIGVRLEDLKKFPKKTLPALCKWIGIKENESLYEMTMQGKKWWGDPSSPDYKSDGMNPFGNISINRKTGSIFSENDKFILNTLFYPFCVQFGYINENLEKFKMDLHKVKPMINEIFDFEKSIIDHTNQDLQSFIKSGPYIYLRSILKDRLNVLNKFYTYPNMIKPLEIN